jgi:hypothetical protein
MGFDPMLLPLSRRRKRRIRSATFKPLRLAKIEVHFLLIGRTHAELAWIVGHPMHCNFSVEEEEKYPHLRRNVGVESQYKV